MIFKISSATLVNAQGKLIDIEIDISRGLPMMAITGQGNNVVKEAADRVKRAIINSGFEYPNQRITVNLSPAYIKKTGSHFDLGIALGIIFASKQIRPRNEIDMGATLVMGELSLDGKVKSLKGALPMIIEAVKDENIKVVLLPHQNCRECYLATKDSSVTLIPIDSLRDAVEYFKKGKEAYTEMFESFEHLIDIPDFSEIKGHREAKESMVIAASGGHNILMIGPPGSGKTMIAKRAQGILDSMDYREKLETSALYSYAGKLNENFPAITERPFRHVSSNIKESGLFGGGKSIMPGEISLANNGILFMDEFLEFPRSILELLREPLEEKEIRISRNGEMISFPAKVMLIAATNPCKCGYYGDSVNTCTCTKSEIDRYRSKLSGPILDRLDMSVEIPRVEYESLIGRGEMSSSEMRERVKRAVEVQRERFKNESYKRNSEIDDKEIDRFCKLGEEEKKFMKVTYEKFGISPRRYNKLLKLARTIADVEGDELIGVNHLSMALHYTRYLREREG